MRLISILAGFLALPLGAAQATTFQLDLSDFAVSPTNGTVDSFTMSMDITDPLVAGQIYNNPAFTNFDYTISGDVGPMAPSTLSRHNTVRTDIDSTTFASLGGQLEFQISAGADLADGLQVSELIYFGLLTREYGTGSYHPFLLGLSPDGTGALQDADNGLGINPITNLEVPNNFKFGEEYLVELTFDPQLLTLSPAPTSVPLPASALLLGAGVLGLAGLRRREAHSG